MEAKLRRARWLAAVAPPVALVLVSLLAANLPAVEQHAAQAAALAGADGAGAQSR
jgi:hypothetical protein